MYIPSNLEKAFFFLLFRNINHQEPVNFIIFLEWKQEDLVGVVLGSRVIR